MDMGPTGKETTVIETKTRVVIKKATGGYSVIHTPISATMTQNGEDVEDPVLSLLQDTVVTYELDGRWIFVGCTRLRFIIEKAE